MGKTLNILLDQIIKKNSFNKSRLNEYELPYTDKFYPPIKNIFDYFCPSIPRAKLKKLLSLDPTYTGGKEAGEIGWWVSKLYWNGIRNKDSIEGHKTLLSIDPKRAKANGNPKLFPEIKDEDLPKVKKLVYQYLLLKNRIGRSITSFKSLQELEAEISNFASQGVPTTRKEYDRFARLQKLNFFKYCEKLGLQTVFENSKWKIGVPTTPESLGAFKEETKWYLFHTDDAAKESFNSHEKEFILLDKKVGKFYMFRFYPYKTFNDESNNKIDMKQFTQENPEVVKFFKNYYSMGNTIQLDMTADQLYNGLINGDVDNTDFFSHPKPRAIHFNDSKQTVSMTLQLSDVDEAASNNKLYWKGKAYSINSLISLLKGKKYSSPRNIMAAISFVSDIFNDVAKQNGMNLNMDDAIDYLYQTNPTFDFADGMNLTTCLLDCAQSASEIKNTIINGLPVKNLNDFRDVNGVMMMIATITYNDLQKLCQTFVNAINGKNWWENLGQLSVTNISQKTNFNWLKEWRKIHNKSDEFTIKMDKKPLNKYAEPKKWSYFLDKEKFRKFCNIGVPKLKKIYPEIKKWLSTRSK